MDDAPGARTELRFTDKVGTLVGAMTEQKGDGKAGDMLSKGVELVLTAVIFGFLGSLLDRWLGTAPLFLFALGGFALGYQVWKMVVGYNADMAAEEERLLPKRPGTTGSGSQQHGGAV
jgi:hypothetical protein